MTDGEALLRAVVAEPDDDTPRLIYADWLDENAHPERAGFIRAQVEAARAERYSPAARAAESRANRLLEVNRGRWARHLRSRLIEAPRFNRGFIHHVAIEAAGFEGVLAATLAVEPVQSVCVVRSDREGEWASLMPVFRSTHMRRIRRLEFITRRGFLDDEHETLIKSHHNLEEVRSLSLRGNPIHPAWFPEFIRSKALPQLTDLDVADITNLGPAMFHALHRCSNRRLRCLDASWIAFRSEDLQRILASPCLEEVEELRLGFAGRPGGEMGPLAELDIGWVMPWRKLGLLDLTGQRLGDDAARAIAAQRDAASLRWLGLANNELTHDAVEHLIAARHLQLYYLDVRGNNRLTAGHIESLRERFPEAEVAS